MNIMTGIWLAWLVMFLSLEIYGLITNRRGDTFSENVWRWFRVMDERPTILMWSLRAVLLVFLVWLTGHLVFGWWTVWEWPFS
jgi:hypothetical protein